MHRVLAHVDNGMTKLYAIHTGSIGELGYVTTLGKPSTNKLVAASYYTCTKCGPVVLYHTLSTRPENKYQR